MPKGTEIRLWRGDEVNLPALLDGEPAWAVDTFKLFIGAGGSNHQVGGGTTSPLTTKGDVYVYDTGNARFPVGPDGTVLTADSTQTAGLRYSSDLHSRSWMGF